MLTKTREDIGFRGYLPQTLILILIPMLMLMLIRILQAKTGRSKSCLIGSGGYSEASRLLCRQNKWLLMQICGRKVRQKVRSAGLHRFGALIIHRQPLRAARGRRQMP